MDSLVADGLSKCYFLGKDSSDKNSSWREWLRAPWRAGGWTYTQSLIVRPGSVRRIVESTPATDQE